MRYADPFHARVRFRALSCFLVGTLAPHALAAPMDAEVLVDADVRVAADVGVAAEVPVGAEPPSAAQCSGSGVPYALGDTPACVEKLTFRSGELTLAGQWLTPLATPPFPAVVVIRGSGDSTRGNPWTESLAAVLVEEGVGVLIPDKRGSGESEGDWRTASFADLANDALAALQHLADRPDVMEDGIGLMGLSQGGQIVPIAAARSDSVAFVIDVVGAGVPFRENLRFEMLRTFEEEGLSGDALEAAMGMVATAEGYLDGRVSWDDYVGALGRTRELLGDGIVDAYFIPTPDHWRWDFFRRMSGFDPVEWWRRVEQPALVLLGADDRNTPTDETASRLRRVFAETGHPDATVQVFEGLGHDLIDHTAPGPMSEHGLRADVRNVLGSWTARVTRSTR